MENEKEYISTRAYNSLKKHSELIEETKKKIKVGTYIYGLHNVIYL